MNKLQRSGVCLCRIRNRTIDSNKNQAVLRLNHGSHHLDFFDHALQTHACLTFSLEMKQDEKPELVLESKSGLQRFYSVSWGCSIIGRFQK